MDSYRSIDKKVIVFFLSDYNHEIDVPLHVLLFRSGMFRSQQKPNEFLLPYIWVLHELKGEHAFTPLEKRGRYPLVGFCGSIISDPCRIRHVDRLRQSIAIKTKFLLRTAYWAGKNGDQTVIDEFKKNVESTYFTLCSRGTGNFSSRFYQVLYMGRIPIVVNTDMVLPLEDRINWNDVIVWCQTEEELVSKTKEWWNKDMVSAQIKCKEIYEQYLQPAKWCEIIQKEILIPRI